MPYYSCATCDRWFASVQGLESHCYAKRHSSYECRQCNRHFVGEHALQQHRRDSPQHRSSRWSIYKPYHCAPCNRSFKHESALNQHYQNSSAHSLELEELECPFCTSCFTSPSAVAHHIESGYHSITRHQVTDAVKSLDIVPDICIDQRIEGASPTPPTSVHYYVASPRSFNGRAYACFICQRIFHSLYSLSDHLNSAAHDDNEFKCPKCKKRFKLVSSLIQHIESGACRLAGLSQIQEHFQSLTARFSRLISL